MRQAKSIFADLPLFYHSSSKLPSSLDLHYSWPPFLNLSSRLQPAFQPPFSYWSNLSTDMYITHYIRTILLDKEKVLWSKKLKNHSIFFPLLRFIIHVSLSKCPMSPAVDKPVYLCLSNIFKMNLSTSFFTSWYLFIQIFMEPLVYTKYYFHEPVPDPLGVYTLSNESR